LPIIAVWVIIGVIFAQPNELQILSSASLTINGVGELREWQSEGFLHELREWQSEGFLQGMELHEML